ncbi:MAG: GntR family transcriptional regulator [Kiritimatiellae bacterium]|nr:GntR family transcriptional regulator [Kiritimatiellia bacterium]
MNKTVTIQNRLRRAIVSRELPPGTRLVESELARRFRVSRTPIREVLNRLHQEGLIELLPNSGGVVRRYTLTEIIDFMELRLRIEPLACRKAAERATASELKTILRAAERYRRVAPGGRCADIFTAEDCFHGAVYRAAHSVAYSPERVYSLSLLSNVQKPLEGVAVWKRGGAEHLELARLLRRRNGKGAAQLAEKHVLATLKRMKRLERDVTALGEMGLG